MDVITNNISTIMLVLGALIALTNIVVEVIKAAVPNKTFPTNIIAVTVAILLTLIAFVVWANINSLPILWWHILATIVAGVLVAYGAMFGFDKLKEVLTALK